MNGRGWIYRNLRLFWSQINQVYQYKNIDGYTLREVYVGNLKLESDKIGGRWFRPANYREFREYVDQQLEKHRDLKYPGVYISQERYRGPFIECRDLYIDIDFDENDPDQSYKAIKYLDEKLRRLGINILWSLSGNGIHGRLGMLDIFNLLRDKDVFDEFIEDTPRIYSNFIRFLEEYLNKKGYNIKFDRQIYGSRRLIRALYSPHESKEIIEIPIDFRWSLKTNYALARFEHVKVENHFLGYVEDPRKFLNLLFEIDHMYNVDRDLGRPKPRIKVIKGRSGKWIIYNNIKYDSSLEGYGWIETIINNRIYFEDGRETFIWYVLSKAVSIGLVSREEAEEWIRECISKYPDPEHSVEYYIKKLHYNVKAKVNPPTWRTILSESGSRIEDIRHLKECIIPALAKYGYVEILQTPLQESGGR